MQPRRSTRLNSEKRRKTTNIRDLDPFGDDKDYKAQMSLRRKRTSFRYMILCFVVLTIVLISSFAFYRQSWNYITTFAMSKRSLTNTEPYLVFNANIHTVDPKYTNATAFVVQDGKFLEVGQQLILLRKYRHIRKKVDLNGQTVIPGLVDSHAHLLFMVDAYLQVDLTGSDSLTEINTRIRAFAEQREEDKESGNGWIIGRGWDQTKFKETNGQFPHMRDIQYGDVPIVLYRVDYHAVWINEAAFRVIEASLPEKLNSINGGEIVVDANGAPTGIFVDEAMNLVGKHVPPFSEKQTLTAMDRVIKEMVSYGLTGIHDALFIKEHLRLVKKAIDLDRFPIRLYGLLSCHPNQAEMCLSDFEQDLPMEDYKGYGKLKVGGVKLMLDGALGSWGALMMDPYTDDMNKTGLLRIPAETYEKLVWEWTLKGFQIASHAIGDQANKIVLDTYEKTISRWNEIYAREIRDGQRLRGQDLRFRVEHAQILRKEDIQRFAKLNIIPAVQPTHCTSDMSYAEARLGRERAQDGAYIWQGFLKAGVKYLPLGSDFPVEHMNPFLGIYAAVTRKTVNGTSPHGSNGWFPEQKLTRMQALKGFTLDTAYASFQENKLGSITPGKLADFVVLSQDIFNDEVDEKEILTAPVKATVISGVAVFGGL